MKILVLRASGAPSNQRLSRVKFTGKQLVTTSHALLDTIGHKVKWQIKYCNIYCSHVMYALGLPLCLLSHHKMHSMRLAWWPAGHHYCTSEQQHTYLWSRIAYLGSHIACQLHIYLWSCIALSWLWTTCVSWGPAFFSMCFHQLTCHCVIILWHILHRKGCVASVRQLLLGMVVILGES